MEIEVLCTPIHKPDDIYPASCCTAEQKQAWERDYLATGLPLPALRFLPEGSLLREEWHRRKAAFNTDKESAP